MSGGSGKQSLAKLASFICGYEVVQIAVTSSYGVTEFKENLLSLYAKAGTKGIPITFLMTDNQIVKEKFLVYINDLLSTGYIADLCTPEDKEAFCNAVRNEVKQAGMIDSVDNCWDFFIDKVSLCQQSILQIKQISHNCLGGDLHPQSNWLNNSSGCFIVRPHILRCYIQLLCCKQKTHAIISKTDI